MIYVHDMPCIKNVFPNLLTTGGFFTETSGFPWEGYERLKPSKNTLDKLLYLNYGDRIVSPVVWKLLDENGELSQTNATNLSSMFLSLNYNSLYHLWKAMEGEYNPLDNVSAHEVETHETIKDETTLEKEGTESLTHGYDNYQTTDEMRYNSGNTRTESGTEMDTLTKQMGHTESRAITPNLTETHGGTDTTMASGTDTNTSVITGGNTENDNAYGFNAVNTSVPVNQKTVTYNNQQTQTSIVNGRSDTTTHGHTVTQTGTQSDSLTYGGTDTDTSTKEFANRQTSDEKTGTDTRAITKEGTETETTSYQNRKDITTHEYKDTRVYDRSGNIGVTSSAQLIQGEINLWEYNFFEKVVRLAADFLSLCIY